MKFYRAELGGIQPWMWFNNGAINEHHRQWTQMPEHWTLFFFEHAGALSINNRVYPYEVGNVALIAPGTKAGFMTLGPETIHFSMTFGLTKRTEVVALPSLADLGPLTEVRRREFQEAEKWLSKSIGRGLACAYNILWSIAQPIDVIRSSAKAYDFERYVLQSLSKKLSVSDLADELEMSQSQLLRMVKGEYGLTVQEFVREKRTEVARTLITSTDEPLKLIATKTGMPDLQYFNKTIRQSSGLSPRALRELAINRTRH